MAIDNRLAKLADWEDSIENQLQTTVDAGASEVSDSDASVRRLAMTSLRTELKMVRKDVTRRRIVLGGGDPLFGFRLKQESSTNESS